ncbi:hypothetical protein [Gluconobacter morbifer]|uniref:Transmembrane protein n=1 Tax=Gluconobacter morbifer G707 TaxID=1088869 RepID=G6XME7_9PROT|nr:hypothetical protein [Gluconobacter morbifer]EHH67045.1 hypothetical protein GMO_26650 [Gluconobacter morbifer G707]
MLMISLLCFTLTVIAGVWLGIKAMEARRPPRALTPVHVLSASAGAVFLLVALNQGDSRLLLNVALAVAIAGFGVLMSWARRRGYVIVPLYMCHVLLAVMFYLSLACFALFPKF